MSHNKHYNKTLIFDTEYVGQKADFTEIPSGYVDKTVCGCGLTSIALENSQNTIIAVPNTPLVVNKVNQYPNSRYSGEVFGVYGGISKDDVNLYVSRCNRANKPIKIIVCYDSLYKVESLLNSCKFVIDESDQLIKQIGLKIQDKTSDIDVYTYLLEQAERHKDNVSFISATPTPIKYLPQWIGELDQVKMYFTNTIKVTPMMMKRQYPYKALQNEIIRPIKNSGQVVIGDRTIRKVIVFINSVENILKIIKECQLDPEKVAILCGDNTRNDYKIRGYKRIDRPDCLPQYTFITSSGFQGIDLTDSEAINVVVSNTTKGHQMINLITDLKQAVSRQRNKKNPNYNRFIYIYNQNNFAKTESEILQIISDSKKQVQDNCQLLNDLKNTDDDKYTSTLKTFQESKLFKSYSLYKDGKHHINELAFNADEYNILETRRQFTEGFNLIGLLPEKPIEIEAPHTINNFSYANLLEKYRDSLSNPEITFSDDETATTYFQTIDSYYKEYGKLTSNYSYAKKMITAKDDWSKIIIEVRNTLQLKRYPLKEIKAILTKIYDQYGIARKAKETDLNEFGIKYHKTKSSVYYVTIESLT
jgi:hypothetical protein